MADVEQATNSSATDPTTAAPLAGAAAPPPEEEEPEEFVVEKIINHRFTKKGKLEYFLKWKGFTDVDNTWEPAENLNCPELVEAYEAEKEKNKKDKKSSKAKVKVSEEKSAAKGGGGGAGKKRKTGADESATGATGAARNEKQKKSEKQNGFDRGLTAEEIIGAMENNGEVHFLIKWKEPSQDYELIPCRIVNIKIPQMVIAFYETRLTWSTASSSQDIDEAEETKKNGDGEEEEDEASAVNGDKEEQAPDEEEKSAPS